SLFIGPACNSYYFGDYYGAPYLTAGFSPWWSWGPRYYDPLFGYYRWHYRNNSGWYNGLRNTYAGRVNGTIARPARTFVSSSSVANVSLVTPFSAVAGARRLTALSAAQVQQHAALARHITGLGRTRATIDRAAFPSGNRGRLTLPGSASVTHHAPAPLATPHMAPQTAFPSGHAPTHHSNAATSPNVAAPVQHQAVAHPA